MKIDGKKVFKWASIAAVAVIAALDEFCSQQQEERIENMEERLYALELDNYEKELKELEETT